MGGDQSLWFWKSEEYQYKVSERPKFNIRAPSSETKSGKKGYMYGIIEEEALAVFLSHFLHGTFLSKMQRYQKEMSPHLYTMSV